MPSGGGSAVLLLGNLHPLDAFIAVEELLEVFSLVSVDSDDEPGFTPWLFERVGHVADYRLPRRDRESMRCTPLSPCRLRRVAAR